MNQEICFAALPKYIMKITNGSKNERFSVSNYLTKKSNPAILTGLLYNLLINVLYQRLLLA